MAHPTALDRPGLADGSGPDGSRTDEDRSTGSDPASRPASAAPEARPEPSGADGPGAVGWSSTARWMTLVVVTVVVIAAIPLAWQPRWYFYGDTQAGAYGQWYHLGKMLASGQWPLLDVQGWSSGNFVAEGQWGLFSPLTAAIGLVAVVSPNAVVFTTVVKFVLLAGGACGVYGVVRSYGLRPAAGYLAAVAATTGGVTQYLESPSWVTGQMVWALLPWFWWQLRRVVNQRANPAPALVFGFLMITVGYVYGVLYVAIAVLGCMVDAFRAGRRPGAARMLLVGVLCALLSVTVYLPAVLTAPVTVRGGAQILSDGNLQGTVYTTLTAMLPLSPGPATYMIWFLPMLAWLSPSKLAGLVKPMIGLIIGLLLTLAWTLGPNQIGPIRWPLRVLPILTFFVVVCTVIAVVRARVDRLSRARLAASLVVLTAMAFVVVSRSVTSVATVMLGTGVAAAGLTLTWFALRRAETRPGRWARTAAPLGGFGVLVTTAVTIGVVVLQHSFYTQPPSANRNMPTLVDEYDTQASAARGDVQVVGDPEQAVIADKRVAKDFLIASSWYVSPQQVQNEYTTIGFKTYNNRFCIHYNGTTCPTALKTLFSVHRGTKKPRVDLLSISTLQIYRPDFSAKRLASPPKGWHVAATTDYAVTWVRDRPLPTSGGVTWRSSGIRVRTVSSSQRRVVLSVQDVPAGGGHLVFSRLDWPGYQVTGATHAAPTDGYLLTVDVPASAKGRRVVVTFDPPGWTLEKATAGVAALVSVVWVLLHLVLGVRRRRRLSAPAVETPRG